MGVAGSWEVGKVISDRMRSDVFGWASLELHRRITESSRVGGDGHLQFDVSVCDDSG